MSTVGMWLPEAYNWYREACDTFDYPGLPFGKQLKKLISDGDTVLDLGCGIGAISIMMAPWCKRVIAMDPNEQALDFLGKIIKELNIKNIETVRDNWPCSRQFNADVIVALHIHKLFYSLEPIKSIFNMASKGGFIACHAVSPFCDEDFAEMKKELGVRLNAEDCANGCYAVGVLEALGARVTCEKVLYDFGQPLDTMEDAIRFISWQTGVDEQAVKKYTDRYVIREGDRYSVPIKRCSCAISFVK